MNNFEAEDPSKYTEKSLTSIVKLSRDFKRTILEESKSNKN